jgi:hypothetical protein
MTRARNLGEIADSSYISAVGNKIGIGSTVPQYTLDVIGDINFTGNFRQNGTIFSSGVGIQSAGTAVGYGITTLNFVGTGNTFAINGNTVDISISGGGGGSSYWVQTDVGIHTLSSVGVGTTNPSSKLEVSGDVSIASTVSIGTTIDIIPYNSLGTLSFEGSAGQLFSITNNLTSGSIFSVNDVSGIPSIDVNADGTIQLAPYNGRITVGAGDVGNCLDITSCLFT